MKKIFVFIMILLLTGCMGETYKNITVEEAKEMIDQEKVTILDVRTPEEYNSGHIPGSELLPLQVFEGMVDKFEKDKSYVIVCRSGNRSQQASEILAKSGFKKVYNMSGGMNQWSYEIEQ